MSLPKRDGVHGRYYLIHKPRANDQFSASIQGAGLEMGFNNRYLLDALRNTEGDEVRIQLNGPLSPMKIMPPRQTARKVFMRKSSILVHLFSSITKIYDKIKKDNFTK